MAELADAGGLHRWAEQPSGFESRSPYQHTINPVTNSLAPGL